MKKFRITHHLTLQFPNSKLYLLKCDHDLTLQHYQRANKYNETHYKLQSTTTTKNIINVENQRTGKTGKIAT
jgi:hypothetical protein